jgi:WD40 repeat protein/uncharacterized caspase-like protein
MKMMKTFNSILACGLLLLSIGLAFGQTTDERKLELVVQTGHSEYVKSVAISQDGRFLASVGGNTIIWEASTGKFIKQLGGEENLEFTVFSPNGKILAGYSEDYPKEDNLILWNVDTGEQMKKWKGSFYGVNPLAFSPDGKLIATTDIDGSITIWDVEAGKVKKIEAHETALSVAFSPDGNILVSSGQDKESPIKFWDVKTWKLINFLKGHQENGLNTIRVWSAVFSPNGKLLATSGFDNTVRLWDWENKRIVHTVGGFKELNRAIAFSPDGKMLATTGDNRIRLWSIATGKEILTIGQKSKKEFADVVLSLKFSGDSKTLLSNSSDNISTFWDAETGTLIKTIIPKKISSVTLLKDKQSLELRFGSEKKLLNLANIQQLKTFTENSQASLDTTYLPDSKGLVVQINGRAIKILRDGTVLKLLNDADSKEIGKIVLLEENNWAVVTPDGRFDASEGALKLMHYAYGLEIINLEQLKEAYYEPALLQKLLGYSKEPLRPIVPLKDVKLYPEIVSQTIAPDSTKLQIKLKNRGGGIGAVQVFVGNELGNKLVVEDARDVKLKQNPNVAEAMLEVDLRGTNYLKGQANKITVVTSNYLKEIGKGNIQSRGAEIVWTPKGNEDFQLPTLYAIVGGVSDYEGERIDLRFAAKDAEDFAHALSLGARKLFCDKSNPNCLDKVNITTLSTNREKPEEQPTKENFKRAFADIAARAKPEDIVVIYLAGHGVSFGAGTDSYFYLTKEARTTSTDELAKVLKTSTISSEELTDWLTFGKDNANDIFIKAMKQVIILDTCASGNAAGQLALTAKRDLSGDQIRAVEFLKDKTGTFVLMASTADAPSYEASQFGQGLLTYSLLQAMKGAALDKGEYVDIQQLFSYAQKQVPQLAQNIGGVQRPIVSAPLGKTFVIGQMTDAEKRNLNLPSPKPLLLRPLLTNPETGDDDLKLIPALRKMLDAESSYEVMRRSGKGEPKLIYIDDDNFPGAFRLTGTYTVEGENIRVKAFLRQDGKTIATLQEILITKEKLSEELLTVVRAELVKLTGR